MSFFRFFYGRFEIGLEFFAGFFALLAPAAFLQQMAPAFLVHDDGNTAAALLMVREFGMMNIAFGVLQLTFVAPWELRTARRFLLAMLPGDVMHLVIAGIFCVAHDAVSAGNVFNLGLSVVTPILRAYFVFGPAARALAAASLTSSMGAGSVSAS